MRWKFNQFPKVICFIALISLTMSSGMARADYIYTYTGLPFDVTTTMIMRDGDDWITYENTFESKITAAIRTSSLLTPGAGLTDIISISMTGEPFEGSILTLEYPGPPIDPYIDNPPWVGANVNIISLDSSGLPATWNIGVAFGYFSGGRDHLLEFGTSNLSDGIYGYDEPFNSFSGRLQGNPGSWQLSWVASVPENKTEGMLLLGLGFIGFMFRHNKYRGSVLKRV
jgi:hypothetical protein